MRPPVLLGIALVALVLAAAPASADWARRMLGWAARIYTPLAVPEAELPAAQRAAVDLGEKLFADNRLSPGGDRACATCHVVAASGAGVDNRDRSPGADGQPMRRNTPTVLNAALNRRFFWDGRSEDLSAAIESHLLDEKVLGIGDPDALRERIASTPSYAAQFAAAFPERVVDTGAVASALAAYTESLLGTSRFDAFLRGDAGALSKRELTGLKLFLKVGCNKCHNGTALGGYWLETMGKYGQYPDRDDRGVAELTGKSEDAYRFRVPGLRNVAITAPYFHDGGVAGLVEAVKVMAEIQRDRALTDDEAADIAAFLGTLTSADRERAQGSDHRK